MTLLGPYPISRSIETIGIGTTRALIEGVPRGSFLILGKLSLTNASGVERAVRCQLTAGGAIADRVDVDPLPPTGVDPEGVATLPVSFTATAMFDASGEVRLECQVLDPLNEVPGFTGVTASGVSLILVELGLLTEQGGIP